MKFEPTPLPGAFLISLERRGDERGFFARTFCTREMSDHGLETNVAQCNISLSTQAGTLRGLHYQIGEAAEAKLVCCVAGALWDVIVDLRPESQTYRKHFGTELSARNAQALYLPRGVAHGFLTLEEDTVAFYQASNFYYGHLERGLRYDDPQLSIRWPREVSIVSDKDAGWPDLE